MSKRLSYIVVDARACCKTKLYYPIHCILFLPVAIKILTTWSAPLLPFTFVRFEILLINHTMIQKCRSYDIVIGVRIMVFNATFNNISVISWRLFYWWRKPEYPEKATIEFIHIFSLLSLASSNFYIFVAFVIADTDRDFVISGTVEFLHICYFCYRCHRRISTYLLFLLSLAP